MRKSYNNNIALIKSAATMFTKENLAELFQALDALLPKIDAERNVMYLKPMEIANMLQMES